MDILIQEAPQLIISLALIITSGVLMGLRIASVLEGTPLLILVAGYWIGNGSARFSASKVEQTLTAPQVDQLMSVLQKAPTQQPPIAPQPIILPEVIKLSTPDVRPPA